MEKTKFKIGDRVLPACSDSGVYLFANVSGSVAHKNGVIGTIISIDNSGLHRVQYDRPVNGFATAVFRDLEIKLISRPVESKPTTNGSLYLEDTPSEWADTLAEAFGDSSHDYHSLACALVRAFGQAAVGKGKERHANDMAFDEQPMQLHSDAIGNTGGMCYQVQKKAVESMQMNDKAADSELCGAIVYAAGMMVWRQRNPKDD